jgi:hypothetical protein
VPDVMRTPQQRRQEADEMIRQAEELEGRAKSLRRSARMLFERETPVWVMNGPNPLTAEWC